MNYNHVNKELFSFLDRSPNAFYAVKNMCDVLSEAGMTRLGRQGIFCHQK